MSAFGFYLDGLPSRLRDSPFGSTTRMVRRGCSTGRPWSFIVSFHRVKSNHKLKKITYIWKRK